MKDIICECGHDSKEHSDGGCLVCACTMAEVAILRAHIAKRDEVIEAARGVIPAILAAVAVGVIDHLDAWDGVDELWTRPLTALDSALAAIGT